MREKAKKEAIKSRFKSLAARIAVIIGTASPIPLNIALRIMQLQICPLKTWYTSTVPPKNQYPL